MAENLPDINAFALALLRFGHTKLALVVNLQKRIDLGAKEKAPVEKES